MNDRDYMARAIEIAKRGLGWTNPNPMVGAVVVKDGRIISEGAHLKCGEYHAERNALLNCSEDPEGATIYVTLEPCCHYGKTPPCTEIIMEKKLARVVIGSRDPNPLVAGKGAAILREAGITVEEDFMREECDALNPVFFHYITEKRPYVVMKYAMTLDGKIATRTGASQWISNESSRAHTHALRGRYAAIMAGIGTVLADNPMLNCRLEGAHQPLRIICDSRLRIPEDCRIVETADKYRTMIACGALEGEEACLKKTRLEEKGIRVLEIPDENGQVNLKELMAILGEEKIDSVFVEGGGTLHEACLKAGIVDHVYAYIAPKIFGGKDAKSPVEGFGVAVPDECYSFTNMKITEIEGDVLLEFDAVKNEKGGTSCSQE